MESDKKQLLWQMKSFGGAPSICKRYIWFTLAGIRGYLVQHLGLLDADCQPIGFNNSGSGTINHALQIVIVGNKSVLTHKRGSH
jgi:hypothetical protein